jgi:ABC-type transport system involved in cytochrome c biogenesis permease subunit
LQAVSCFSLLPYRISYAGTAAFHVPSLFATIFSLTWTLFCVMFVLLDLSRAITATITPLCFMLLRTHLYSLCRMWYNSKHIPVSQLYVASYMYTSRLLSWHFFIHWTTAALSGNNVFSNS